MIWLMAREVNGSLEGSLSMHMVDFAMYYIKYYSTCFTLTFSKVDCSETNGQILIVVDAIKNVIFQHVIYP